MKQHVVYYLGRRPVPEGASRWRTLALQEAGFDVVVVGVEHGTCGPSVVRSEGIEYHALQAGGLRGKVGRYFTEGCALRDWLAAVGRSESPRTVIVSQPYSRRLARILPVCQRLGMPCVADVMEWFSAAMLVQKFGFPGFLDVFDTQLALRFGMGKASGVLAISRYLEQHCARQKVRVLRLPPLLDTQSRAWRFVEVKDVGSELRLLFMGTYLRDRQDLLLAALVEARRRGLPVRLDFLGCNRDDFCRGTGLLAQVDSLGAAIGFHGRVAFEEVPRIAGSADFAVLLRDDARWSRACFPSRVAELAALGVPMLCNLTSDLGLYLKDGVNSVIVSHITVSEIVAVLERAVHMPASQRLHMRRAARQMAESTFDFRPYSKPLRNFLVRLQPR